MRTAGTALLLASFIAVAWPLVTWLRSRRREGETGGLGQGAAVESS